MEQVDGEVVARVRDGDDADQRRAAAGGAGFAAREGIEQGGLARLRQADEADFQIAILDDVFAAFQAQFAGGLGGVPGLGVYQVLEGQHFGADEAARQVGVDAARRRQRVGPGGDGPGAHLVLADREEGLHPQRLIRRPNQPATRRLGDAQGVQELALVVLGQLRHFLLGGGAQGDERTPSAAHWARRG